MAGDQFRSPAPEIQGEETQKQGRFPDGKISDSRRRQPRTGAWEEGEERGEEEEDLPQPPETSSAAITARNQPVSAA